MFSNIAPDAVPQTAAGQSMYRVRVAQFLTDGGDLVGAALTCRSQVAVMSTMMPGLLGDYSTVMDAHSELDLIAVRPDARSSGVGSALIAFLEKELTRDGVQVWFGNATRDLDASRLRDFYTLHNFIVGPDGADLPTLIEHTWTAPGQLAEQPAFYFYKQLADSPPPPSSAPARPVPPDPSKARRPKKPKKKRGR